MKRLIPPFMRNPTYFVLAAGGVGTLVYTFFKQRTDSKLSHPLVKESILLLQNNDEIVQLIGVPIVIEPTIGTRAAVSSEIANFSFKVRGPRGKVAVELAGQNLPLSEIGPNAKAKAALPKETAQLQTLDEHNFNDYYVPDKDALKDYYSLSNPITEEDQAYELKPSDRFWKYEYLFAEVDRDARVLIAPDEKLAQSQPAVAQRRTLADLKREFQKRMHSYRVMDKNLTTEEKEEFRKIKLNEHYRRVGYVRNYLMLGVAFVAMNMYVLFRKNKRLPIIGGSLQANIEKLLLRSPEFRSAIPEFQRAHFIESSIGARIGNNANYKFYFMAPDNAGTVHVNCDFNPETGIWKVKQLEFEITESKKGASENPIKIANVTDL